MILSGLTPTDGVIWGMLIGAGLIAFAIVGWLIDVVDKAAQRYAEKKDAPEG